MYTLNEAEKLALRRLNGRVIEKIMIADHSITMHFSGAAELICESSVDVNGISFDLQSKVSSTQADQLFAALAGKIIARIDVRGGRTLLMTMTSGDVVTIDGEIDNYESYQIIFDDFRILI